MQRHIEVEELSNWLFFYDVCFSYLFGLLFVIRICVCVCCSLFSSMFMPVCFVRTCIVTKKVNIILKKK